MTLPYRITTLPRDLSLDERRVIGANNSFGLKLFREVEAGTRDTVSNLCVSPLSVTMALAMLYNGAAGRTEAIMRRALGLDGMTLDDVNRAYHGLIHMLHGLDAGVRFLIGNSIWCRHGITLAPAFIDAARTWFDARAETLDFSDPGAARIINDWVSQATMGRITQIVSSPMPSLAWMHLLNAIYFKGDWTEPFVPGLTHRERFWRADGSQMSVSMMSHGEVISVGVADTADSVLLDLPYGGAAFSMTIVMPREPGGIHALVSELAEQWHVWTAMLRSDRCSVRLPKFRLESDVALSAALDALGMGVVLGAAPAEAPDFARMGQGSHMYLTEGRHRSYVDVNEEGTEAAAATLIMVFGSVEPTREVVVDRPFVFAIRENLSGTILFLGRVLAPGAG